MASRQSRAVYLDATKRAVERLRLRFAKDESVLGPDSAKLLKFFTELLYKLVEDTRTEAFVEFAACATDKLDNILDAVVDAYITGVSSQSIETTQKSLKELMLRLRESAKFMHRIFSTTMFESPNSAFGLMTRQDRLQFLERLTQAMVMIELGNHEVDQQIFQTPTTRKQHGIGGASTHFYIALADAFQREFGDPNYERVAEVADVLFGVDENKGTGSEAVRSARRRSVERKRNLIEPKLEISVGDDLKAHMKVTRAVAKGKPED